MLPTSIFDQLAKCKMPLQVARRMNIFSNEICLNVKHQRFIFQHTVQIDKMLDEHKISVYVPD